MDQLSSLCLSVTPNFRCVSLSTLQSVALIIPSGLEFFFSLWLALAKGKSDLNSLLLALDGISFFAIALIDLLSHVLREPMRSETVFRALDITIGALSFLPLLLYIAFLFRISIGRFLPYLPHRLQNVPKLLLFLLIPIIVAVNEVASFVGFKIEFEIINGRDVLGILFSDRNPMLWYSLSASSLAVFTATQLLFFLLTFFRMGKALANQRRIETSQTDEHHFLNGIVWMTVGINIGAIETIVGFSPGLFSVPLARRILRLVGRSCLIIGVLKGFDKMENFENLTDELRRASRASRTKSQRFSTLRGLISNQPFSLLRNPRPSESHSPICELAQETKGQRVTVHYDQGHAPYLQIRFSNLELPEPAVLSGRRRSTPGILRTFSDGLNPARPDGFTPRAKSAMPDIGDSSHLLNRPFRGVALGHERMNSGATISDNLSVVRSLASKFPGLPPRVTGRYRGSVLGDLEEVDRFPVQGVTRDSQPSTRTRRGTVGTVADGSEETGGGVSSLSPSSSVKRKPAPSALSVAQFHFPEYSAPRAATSVECEPARGDSPTEGSGPPWTPESEAHWTGTGTTLYSPRPGRSPSTAGTRSPMSPRELAKRTSRAISDVSIRSAEWLTSPRDLPRAGQLSPADIELYRSGAGWHTAPGEIQPAIVEEARPNANPVAAAWRKAGSSGQPSPATPVRPTLVTRVSIGRVPMRMTPTPTHTAFTQRDRIMSSHGSVKDYYNEPDVPHSARISYASDQRTVSKEDSRPRSFFED